MESLYSLFPFLFGGSATAPPLQNVNYVAGAGTASGAGGVADDIFTGGAQYVPQDVTTGSAGGVASSIPSPRPRPPEAGQGLVTEPQQVDRMSLPSSQQLQRALGGALRGVGAPRPPDVQKVSTPPPPRQPQLSVDSIVNLLTSLGVGPQQIAQMRLRR